MATLPAPPAPATVTAAVCTNCGAEAAEVYCARCGERQPHHADLSLRGFAANVVNELSSLDSKLFRTLHALLTVPGKLTVDHFAGRKSRHLSPLRVFLATFALQLLVFTLSGPQALWSVGSFTRYDESGVLTRLVERRAAVRDLAPEAYAERIDQRWHATISLLQLGQVVGLALVLQVLFAGRRRHLVEHLVFAAHYLSFTFLLSLAAWPVYALAGFAPGPLQRTMVALNVAVSFGYLFLAMRRYYGRRGRVAMAVTAAVAVAGGYGVKVLLIAGGLILAVAQVG